MLSQSDPSEWAPPPVPAPPPVEEEEQPAAPAAPAAAVEKPVVDAPSPDPSRFTWGHFVLALMGAYGSTGYFAVRVEAGAVFGWPRRIEDTLNRAMGLSLALAVDLLAAKVRVRMCGTAGVCGSRYQAGLALRAAWSWGVIGDDAVVAPIHSVFLQAVGYGSSNSVPSAPLAPGSVWGEHGLRFDLGMTSGFLRGSTWPKPGAYVLGGGLYVAVSLEWMIVHAEDTGTLRAGLSLGVGI